MSTFVMSILHSLAVTAAVYVPAYAMQSTLAVTLGVYVLALVILNVVYKRVVGGTGLPSTAAETAVSFLLGLFPIVLVGLKFGFLGAFAFFLTGILVGFVTMYI